MPIDTAPVLAPCFTAIILVRISSQHLYHSFLEIYLTTDSLIIPIEAKALLSFFNL